MPTKREIMVFSKDSGTMVLVRYTIRLENEEQIELDSNEVEILSKGHPNKKRPGVLVGPARSGVNGAYSARKPGVASVRSRNLSQLESIFRAIASSSARFSRATSAVCESPAFLAKRSSSW
jgi:hypothetical protein